MVKFLSPEWIVAFDAALQQADPPADANLARQPLVVQHIVLGEDGEECASYAVTVGIHGCGATAGHHADPTVTYTQTIACAVSVASGERSAHDAVMVGELSISGDVTALIASSSLVVWLNNALAPIRATTEFDAADE